MNSAQNKKEEKSPASTAPKAVFLNINTPPHLFTLIIIAGLGALNMNIYLPSLPAMTDWFKTEYTIMQLAISAYLAMTALVQLIVGPLSDRYGRRPVLILALIIFFIANTVAALATTIELFLFARLVQATVVSGLVLARAMVRDIVPLEKTASMMGYVAMGMSLVPMFAPAMGGIIQEMYGWQAVLWATGALCLVILIIVWLDLQETNHHKNESITAQFKSYPELLTSRRFWGYVFSALCTSGMFFALLGGAPYIAQHHLHLSPSSLGLYFTTIAFGYMVGNFFTGRYSSHIGLFPMMYYGGILAVIGITISLIWFVLGMQHAMGFFLPLFLVGVGNGMVLPSAMAGMVNVRPHLAGSAAGLGGAMQIGGGAALSALAGHLLTPQSGPAPLLILMFTAGIFGLFFIYYTQIIERQMNSARTVKSDTLL